MRIWRIAFIVVAPMTLLFSGLFTVSGFAKEIKPITPYEIMHAQVTDTVYLPIVMYTPPKDLIVIRSPYENRPEYSDYVTYFGEFWNNTGKDIGQLPVPVFILHLGIKRFNAVGKNDRAHIDLDFFLGLPEIDGFGLAHAPADIALVLFEVKTAVIDIGDQGDGLRKIDMHGLVL